MSRMPLFEQIQQLLNSPFVWVFKHLKLNKFDFFYHIKTVDFNFIIFRIVAPIALIILVMTYISEWLKKKDKVITYAKGIDSNLKDLVKNVDRNVLNDINMKEFTIGKYAFKAGQKAVVVTNWNEQYSGTILGMNNVGVIYLLLNNNGDVYALDIRGIKCLNLT